MTGAGAGRDYAREIADAMKAGDISAMCALAIELNRKAGEAMSTVEAMRAAEEERRKKNASRQQRFRDTHSQPSRNITPRNVTKRHVTSGDVVGPVKALKEQEQDLKQDQDQELIAASSLRSSPQPAVSPNGGKKPRPAPKYPNFPESDCFTLHRAWEDIVGGVDYGRFRRAFGPLFRQPKPDYAIADLVAGIRAGHDDAQQRFDGGDDFAVRNYTPESFVGQARHWVAYARQPTQDAEGNLTAKGRRLAGIR